MQKGQRAYFFRRLFPLLLVCFVVISAVCYVEAKNYQKEVIELVRSTIHNEENIIKRDINDSVSDVLFLKKTMLTLFHENNASFSENFINQATQTAATFSRYHPLYSMVRLINNDGQEVLRINNRYRRVRITPQNKLPNKKHRYYFKKLMQSTNNSIYFSPLDLNMLHKKIERPYRPMIRIGTPVISKKRKRLGVLVVNYNAQQLVEELKFSGGAIPGSLLVINENGHFLVSNKVEHEWGNMLDSRKNITAKKLYPSFWEALQKGESNEIVTDKGVFLITDIRSVLPVLKGSDLRLKLVWFIPKKDLIPKSIKYYIALFLFLSVILFCIAWVWAGLKVKQAKDAEKLNLLARTDPLTGIANRYTLFESGSLEFERAKRFKHRFAILMIDIDFFKNVNDSHGHLNGDKTLILVAQSIAKEIRNVDMVARLGGEEFVVILPETSLASAVVVAEKLCEQIKAIKIPIDGGYFSITASIGVSHSNHQDCDLNDVIHRADKCLYQAKEAGRNRVWA